MSDFLTNLLFRHISTWLIFPMNKFFKTLNLRLAFDDLGCPEHLKQSLTELLCIQHIGTVSRSHEIVLC